MMRTSSSYETPFMIRLLCVGASLAGLLCLALAGLLPWVVFAALAGVHLMVLRYFFDREVISAPVSLALVAVVSSWNAWRIFEHGADDALWAVRDLVVAIAVVRLLSRKTGREILQILGIALSEAIFATILTQSATFLFGMCCMALILPMALDAVDAEEFRAPVKSGAAGARHWARVFAGIVCSSCVLFYLLPRPASPIVRHSLVHDRRHTFGEDVDLGSQAAPPGDTAVLMRIVWDSPDRPKSFYLAGARLEVMTPDGFFHAPDGDTAPGASPCEAKPTDRLTVYQTGIDARYVFHPFTVCRVRPAAVRSVGPNLFWQYDVPLKYDLWVTRTPLSSGPGSNTALPPGMQALERLSSRVSGEGGPSVRMERLARYLRSRCSYSDAPPARPSGASGIEWFVFSGRAGTCEHFAAALAALARASGIPARVVSGFFVSEFNEGGGYFIVRASDAHAWVEYLDGAWLTADATPGGIGLERRGFHLVDRLRFLWVRWVVEYSLDDQIDIAFKTFRMAGRFKADVLRVPYRALAVPIAAAAIVALIQALRRSRRACPYASVIRAFRTIGIVLDESVPHERHLVEVGRFDAGLGEAFATFLGEYLAWRFGGGKVDIDGATRRIVRAIKAHRAQGPRRRRVGSRHPHRAGFS